MAKGIKQTIAVPSVRKTRGTNIATAIRLQVGFRLEAVLFASSDLMLRLDLPDPPLPCSIFATGCFKFPAVKESCSIQEQVA